MSNKRFSILSFIALIAALAMLGGIISTTAILSPVAAVDIYLDADIQQDSDDNFPCTTSDCTCSVCANATILNDIPSVKSLTASVAAHVAMPHHYHPQEYLDSIEYPPESA
ncbi:MAG: hypothetical protein RBQ99_01305 [Trichlorobacter sp.]|nr:hypothetical protein [Trichlorobacter sp.]